MIRAVGFSNVGNVRNNHEDNFLLGSNQMITPSQQVKMINNLKTLEYKFLGTEGIFCVCDGMGGHAAGEVASYQTVQWLNNYYSELLDMNILQLQQAFGELNNYLYEYSCQHESCHDMGATLAGMLFAKKHLYCFNIGDSRVYQFINGNLRQLTIDHTEGQRLLALGLLDKEKMESFRSRKSLYRYLGYAGQLIADITEIELNYVSKFLICSDGLTDVLQDEQIEKIFAKENAIEVIGSKLVEEILSMGKRCTDNITVILIEMQEE